MASNGPLADSAMKAALEAMRPAQSPNWSRGSCVLTPRGLAAVTDYDVVRDRVTTDLGVFDAVDLEVVVPDFPDFSDLEAVEAWLCAGPQPAPARPVAQRATLSCKCDCQHCYVEFMARAGLISKSHFRNTGCRCAEGVCC